MPRYYFKKEDLKLNNIEYVRLYFDNNEYISLYKDEILDYEFIYQDRLISYRDGIYPYAKTGYINFNIRKYSSGTVKSNFIYNEKAYIKNRKQYILDRCMDGGICCIEFFDNNNWSMKVFGNFNPIVKNDAMSFEILDSKNKNISDTFYIDMLDIKKDKLLKLHLDFENCEGIYLYESDLLEVNLNIREYLELGSSYLERIVDGGFIKIKFNKNIKYRDGYLFDVSNNVITINDAIKRIMLTEEHWICNLYITYNGPGYGDSYKEKMIIQDIRYSDMEEYLSDEEYEEDDEDYEYEPYFVGGHVKKEKDVITITFE